MHAGVPLSFFLARQKKPSERVFEDLMVELASDLLIESIELKTFFLLIYSFAQMNLSLTFYNFLCLTFFASWLSVLASFTAG